MYVCFLLFLLIYFSKPQCKDIVSDKKRHKSAYVYLIVVEAFVQLVEDDTLVERAQVDQIVIARLAHEEVL